MSNLPGSSFPVQLESVQTNTPVSEASIQQIGAVANFCLANVMPVGSIIPSALDETTFQGQTGTNWVLCDGRSVIGSQYQALTAQTNIPDLRGRYPRGKDNGAGIDTHGDLPTGSVYGDQFASHRHAPGGADPIRTDMSRFSAGGTNTAPLYGTAEEAPSHAFNVTGNTDFAGSGTETNPFTT